MKKKIILEQYKDGWRSVSGTDNDTLTTFLSDTRADNIRSATGPIPLSQVPHETTPVTFEAYSTPWSKAARARQNRIDKMPLTLWGNQADLTEEEQETAMPMKLSEVTFSADPATLREIAMFLIEGAARLERNEEFDHEHWRMHACLPSTQADVIIMSATLDRT